ncbi:MAG: molybdopterin-binding protein [Planctomycetota bacterium]|jgi:nicotinamide-nucleotide amidase|nr:molybdopterin-binding protein [Planctomycetota bacterium]
MQAEVIAIGDELTSGQRLDTNSRWISRELALLGIPVVFHTTACDTIAAGVEALRAAVGRADVVIATGGLGPTADDLTREVLAAVVGVPLELVPEAVKAIRSRFARRGMPMPESNRRQAMLPQGSRLINNPTGTAPGIDLDCRRADGTRSRVFSLPGVPSEMHIMWRETVQPALLAMQPEAGTIQFRCLKCFGAGESAIEEMLPDLIRRGREPAVGITAHEATITLRIAARGADAAACAAAIAPVEATIRECLGPLVFGTDDDDVEDAAVRSLLAAGQTLASIEIGTAGRVAALLAQAMARSGDGHTVPAVAAGYRGGHVLVPEAARSGDTAAVALAERARVEFGTAIGLGVGAERPVADGRRAIDIAIADIDGTHEIEHVVGGGPSLALARAAKTATDLIRHRLREGEHS